MKIRYLLYLLLVVLLVSCSGGPEQCRTDKAEFEDNFNDTDCGWDEYDKEEASAGYAGSEYRLAIHQPNTTAVALPGGQFEDVAISVEIRQAEGSTDNNYGLLCRYQDMDHFNAFLISSDGYYAIVQVVGGAGYQILSGDGTHLMPSDAIFTGQDATNEITAVCDGDTLMLSVNGQHLASVMDTQFTAGDIGFIASTYDTAPTEILFDNLVVKKTTQDEP